MTPKKSFKTKKSKNSHKKFKALKLTLCVVFLVVLSISCNTTQQTEEYKENILNESELLALYSENGYDEVVISNTSGDEVAHYYLVNNASALPKDIPEGITVVNVPLKNVALDSEVYAGALEELNSSGVIKGMFDSQYVTSPTLKDAAENGRLTDLGNTSSPKTEKIVALHPDAILISYFDGMQTQNLDKLGIPVIKMYDLQESTPLGRAEWIRFLGRLVGRGDQADTIFNQVTKAYNELVAAGDSIPNTAIRPKVLTDIMYEGVWNVPGGASYHSGIIKDAGGWYFKEGDVSPGSLKMSKEQVLLEGGDADIWLIRHYGDEEQLNTILSSDPIYQEIKALKEGNVYFSDTSTSGLFRDFPFHPEKLLKDYKLIFAGDSIGMIELPVYYQKLNFVPVEIEENQDQSSGPKDPIE